MSHHHTLEERIRSAFEQDLSERAQFDQIEALINEKKNELAILERQRTEFFKSPLTKSRVDRVVHEFMDELAQEKLKQP